MAVQLQQSVERQTALIQLAAAGLAAVAQQPRPADKAWFLMHNSLCQLALSEQLADRMLAYQQQSDGALLRLTLQSLEPLTTALAAAGTLPGAGNPGGHATMAALAPLYTIDMAACTLWAAAQTSEPWARIAPAMPHLLSFLRGLHSLVSLAAEAAEAAIDEGPPAQQLICREWLDSDLAQPLFATIAQMSQQQAAAGSSSASPPSLFWSDTIAAVAWHKVVGHLATAFHALASSALPVVAVPSSSQLAAILECVEALLRLAPLLPHLLVPWPSGSSGIVASSPQIRPVMAGTLPVLYLDQSGFEGMSLCTPPHALAAGAFELASWLATATACGLGLGLPPSPSVAAETLMPALNACWAALKYEAAQAAAERQFAAAVAACSGSRQQVRLGGRSCRCLRWL